MGITNINLIPRGLWNRSHRQLQVTLIPKRKQWTKIHINFVSLYILYYLYKLTILVIAISLKLGQQQRFKEIYDLLQHCRVDWPTVIYLLLFTIVFEFYEFFKSNYLLF